MAPVKKVPISALNPSLRPSASLLNKDGDKVLSTEEVDRNNNGYLDADLVTAGKLSAQDYDRLQYALFRKGIISKFRPPSIPSVLPKGVEIRTEIEGDPKIGTIIYVRQLHQPPPNNPITKDELKEIAAYQYDIIDFLRERKAEHLFEEGQTEDIPPGKFLEFKLKNSLESGFEHFIQSLFRKKKEAIVAEEFELVAEQGSNFYAVLNPKATLHKTFTPEQKEERERLRQTKSEEEIRDKREGWAVAQVKEFLEHNPGATIYLVYGGSHEFQDDFLKWEKPPVLVSIAFEGLWPDLDKLNYSNRSEVETALIQTRNRPDLQARIIQRAQAIRVAMFEDIRSEQGQLDAVDKIVELNSVTTEQDYTSAINVYKGLLLKGALSQQVKDKIEEKFRAIEPRK